VTDGLAVGEPRLAGCLRHFYGLPSVPDADTSTRIAERWRPFRTWASVLFRLAGDREGLPADRPPAGRPGTWRTTSGPSGADRRRQAAGSSAR
jgi:DNA-3-methyladenine glycosylase II